MQETERHEEVASLFARVYDLSEEQRDAYLKSRPELRPELVEELSDLLRFDSTDDQYGLPRLEDLFPYLVNLPDGPRERQVGPYRILRTLGEGGLASVFEAVREEDGISREVAIKLLHPESCGAEFNECLRRETSLLAKLKHPNICRLYDWGISQSGRPYHVMELVDGDSLMGFIETGRLSRRDRLRLFCRICDAVSYAHRKDILHLDIKPSNLKVDREGNVKLLDFSVSCLLSAKSRAPEIAVQSMSWYSRGYASPEQMRGDIPSAACDIYSLGILLREMLLRPNSPSVAKPKQSAGPGAMDRELSAIVATASAPVAAKRYETVDALYRDVEDYLQGLPVRAVPHTPWYVSEKYFQRHPMAIAVLLAASGVAVAGLLAVKKLKGERVAEVPPGGKSQG